MAECRATSPITLARAAGAQRVLAVDVALPPPELDESSSGLLVFLQLWDILNKRGQSDTISVAAGDTLVWLRLPDANPSDFAGAASIFEQGYDEGGDAIRSWARRSGLPRADTVTRAARSGHAAARRERRSGMARPRCCARSSRDGCWARSRAARSIPTT